MPQKLFDQIIEKADGVPLFIEELTSRYLERAFTKDFRAQDNQHRSGFRRR